MRSRGFHPITLWAEACVPLALGFLAQEMRGQALSIPNGFGENQFVASAEAEGATFMRMASSTRGEAAPRTYVKGYETGPARSGEFTIGGNLGESAAMTAGRPGKVWWAPLHYSRDMPPLLVRGRSLTSPSDTLLFTSSMVASPVVPGANPVPESERKYFFPSEMRMPNAGRWLLIATSGANWGCFILTVY